MRYGQVSHLLLLLACFQSMVFVVPKKSKMWRCGVESSKTFMVSIDHEETIDDFKERDKVDVRESLHKHRPSDAWTNYFWNYYHQFGK
jgi:hypothetical protein